MGTLCDILKSMLTPGCLFLGDGAKAVIAILWICAILAVGGLWGGNRQMDFFSYNSIASVFLFLIAYVGTCVISRSWK